MKPQALGRPRNNESRLLPTVPDAGEGAHPQTVLGMGKEETRIGGGAIAFPPVRSHEQVQAVMEWKHNEGVVEMVRD